MTTLKGRKCQLYSEASSSLRAITQVLCISASTKQYRSKHSLVRGLKMSLYSDVLSPRHEPFSEWWIISNRTKKLFCIRLSGEPKYAAACLHLEPARSMSSSPSIRSSQWAAVSDRSVRLLNLSRSLGTRRPLAICFALYQTSVRPYLEYFSKYCTVLWRRFVEQRVWFHLSVDAV